MATKTTNTQNKHNPTPTWQVTLNTLGNSVLTHILEYWIFIKMFTRPKILIPLVLTIGLIAYSQQLSGATKLILEIIASVSSGVVGGLVTDSITERSGNSILVKRSTAAIRNLRLIKSKIQNISHRIEELTKKVNVRDFDEVNNLVNNIHKDILNSISDWGDVNPTAEAITDYYEIIDQRENDIKLLTKSVAELRSQKSSLESTKSDKIQDLQSQIDAKEEEIKNLRLSVQRSRTYEGGLHTYTSSTPYLGGGSLSWSPYSDHVPHHCKYCGKYIENQSMFTADSTQQVCDDCRYLGRI